MKYYLLIKSAGNDIKGATLTPLESATALLQTGIWPLWEHTRNRKAISKDDEVAIYLSGTDLPRVIAKAKIASIENWSASISKLYPLQLDGQPYSVLMLTNIEFFKYPISVRHKLSQLSFINKASPKWGVAFMGGTRSLSENDFKLLTNSMSLISFGLPETFPEYLVPEKSKQLVKESVSGMSVDKLLALATERGLDPSFKPLPHMGDDVYGLGVVDNGVVVPFMLRVEIH